MTDDCGFTGVRIGRLVGFPEVRIGRVAAQKDKIFEYTYLQHDTYT
jgi:hypothetical protein